MLDIVLKLNRIHDIMYIAAEWCYAELCDIFYIMIESVLTEVLHILDIITQGVV